MPCEPGGVRGAACSSAPPGFRTLEGEMAQSSPLHRPERSGGPTYPRACPGRPRETLAGGPGLRAASGGFAGGSVPKGSVCPERPLRSTRLSPQLGGGGVRTHIGEGDGCAHSRQQPESLGKHAGQGLGGRRAQRAAPPLPAAAYTPRGGAGQSGAGLGGGGAHCDWARARPPAGAGLQGRAGFTSLCAASRSRAHPNAPACVAAPAVAGSSQSSGASCPLRLTSPRADRFAPIPPHRLGAFP